MADEVRTEDFKLGESSLGKVSNTFIGQAGLNRSQLNNIILGFGSITSNDGTMAAALLTATASFPNSVLSGGAAFDAELLSATASAPNALLIGDQFLAAVMTATAAMSNITNAATTTLNAVTINASALLKSPDSFAASDVVSSLLTATAALLNATMTGTAAPINGTMNAEELIANASAQNPSITYETYIMYASKMRATGAMVSNSNGINATMEAEVMTASTALL